MLETLPDSASIEPELTEIERQVMDAAATRYTAAVQMRQQAEQALQQARAEEAMQLGALRGSVESVMRLRGEETEGWRWRLEDGRVKLERGSQ